MGIAAGVVAGVALLGGASCRPPDTSVRGFDSRQISAGRDDDVRLGAFALDGGSVYRVRPVPDVVATDGLTVPYDLSRFDLETGTETLVAPGVLSSAKLPERLPVMPGDGRSLAILHFPTDADVPPGLMPSTLTPLTLSFFDESKRTSLDVSGVDALNVQLGETDAAPIVVGLVTGERMTTTFVGPPDALLPLPSRFNQQVGRDRGGLITLTSSPEGGTQRFSRFPFDGSPPVTVIPGVLGDHLVATGDDVPDAATPPVIQGGGVSPRLVCPATPATAPASASAAVASASVAPASSTTPPSADPPPVAAPPPPCLLFYDRVWPDKTTIRGFASTLDGAPEVQLPGPLLGQHIADVVQIAPDGSGAFWPTVSSMKQTRVFAWRAGTDQAASCVVAVSPAVATFKVNAWRSRAAGFATSAQPSAQPKGQAASWTLIAGTTGLECHVIATGDNLVKQIAYSPEGRYLAFLVSDPEGMSQLYVTEADNPAPRLIAEGKSFVSLDFHDEQHLLLWRWSIDGYAVSWLDPASPSSPSFDHPIANGAVWDARASWAWLNDHTVLIPDAATPTDDSASLHVIDIDSGFTRLVSRGVVDFAVPWTKRPTGAEDIVVVYTVQSRLASAQDGLWSARIPFSDLTP